MASSMPKERMTEDLLAHLLACDTPEAYLAQEVIVDRNLSDYLNDLLEDRGMNRNQLARISCVNPQFVYDIFKGKSRPERDNALMLAWSTLFAARISAAAATCRRFGAVAQDAQGCDHHMVHRARLYARGVR